MSETELEQTTSQKLTEFSRLYIGIETTTAPGWEDVYAPVQASKAAKKQKTIDDSISVKTTQRMNAAGSTIFSAVPYDICVLDEEKNVRYHTHVDVAAADSHMLGSHAYSFAKWLGEYLTTWMTDAVLDNVTYLLDSHRLGTTSPLIGFGLESSIRATCYAAARHATAVNLPILWPYALFARNTFSPHHVCGDPYIALVPSTHRDDFPLDNVLRYFVISSEQVAMSNSQHRALLAHALAHNSGIV